MQETRFCSGALKTGSISGVSSLINILTESSWKANAIRGKRGCQLIARTHEVDQSRTGAKAFIISLLES